jgi:hypothetical protein
VPRITITPPFSFRQTTPLRITQTGDDKRAEFAEAPSEVRTWWRCANALNGVPRTYLAVIYLVGDFGCTSTQPERKLAAVFG